MIWYLDALKKYAVFTGRARRKEFWTFALVNAAVVLVLTGGGTTTHDTPPGPVALLGLGVAGLSGVYGLAVLVPAVAVSVRRLHGTGRSGAWYLLNFLPFGSLVPLVFACQDSGPDNKHGPNPKAAERSGKV